MVSALDTIKAVQVRVPVGVLFHRYNNELLKSVERLCLPCDMSGDVLEYNN